RPPALVLPDTVLRQLGADLLFCPLAVTKVHDSTVPMVALWNNLTHLHYPQFLEPEEFAAGAGDFHETLRIADNLVCFSQHTRNEILGASRVTAARITALPLQPMRRLPHPPHDTMVAALDRLALMPGHYLLYTAPPRGSSNHKLLLTAVGVFR